MADSADSDIQYLGLMVPALIVLIAGLVIHSFIIGVNVTDWWKGRSVTPVDHIVTSLGISRMCAQFSKTIFFIVIRLFLSKQDFVIHFLIGTACNFFTYANYWLTSLLSVVFSLKISNFHSRLFLYLRGVIVHRTVYLIGASVLLSAFTCMMPLTLTLPNLYRVGIYNTIMANLTQCPSINYVYICLIGTSLPLIFFCISSVLLFTSLYHHITKMKSRSNLTINLETYYSVLTFVSFTFIYNTSYFIGNFVSIFYNYFNCVHLLWLYFVLDVLPALHSYYLIYRTAKLRSQMSKVLHYLYYIVFQRKEKETRENMELVTI